MTQPYQLISGLLKMLQPYQLISGLFKMLQPHLQIQITLLSVAVTTIKRKCFFAHTSSATLNNVVKLI